MAKLQKHYKMLIKINHVVRFFIQYSAYIFTHIKIRDPLPPLPGILKYRMKLSILSHSVEPVYLGYIYNKSLDAEALRASVAEEGGG